MQNFLFLKPFQGFYYQSIKSVLIVLCWILFGYKGKLVFQTSSGANRFKKTFIGAILISIYKFKLETRNPFIAESIKRNRYPDIDLLIVTSTMPYKNNQSSASLIKKMRKIKPDLNVYITLDKEDARVGNHLNLNYTGFVKEQDLFELYKRSKMVFIPSLLESFSIPLHDCLRNSIPVIIHKE